MKNRTIYLAVALLLAFIVPVAAQDPQNSPLPLPPAVEKELAARASNVTEVTLGKNMLGFAAKFMTGKDQDEAEGASRVASCNGLANF